MKTIILVLGFMLLVGCALPPHPSRTGIKSMVNTEVYPARGQSTEQMDKDSDECIAWAQKRVPQINNLWWKGDEPERFNNAYTACMEGRGYAVSK